MRRAFLIPLLGLTFALLLATRMWAEAGVGDKQEVGGKKVSEWLKLLLEDKRPKARRAAIIALEIAGPKADRVLQGLGIALKQDTDPEIRREVAQALGRMGEEAKQSIRVLTEALSDDKEGSVREAAARALGSMAPHSRTVIPELTKALQDSYPGTRTAAVATLKELAAEAKPALPQVIDLLKNARDAKSEPLARVYAAQLLARLAGDAEAGVPVLAGVVADKEDNSQVRAAAAEALGRFGEKAETAAGKLSAVAGDTKADSVLRQKALMALAKVSRDAKVIWPALRGILQEKDSALRSQAVRVAGPLGKQEKAVLTELQKIARADENVEVRVAAIQELDELGSDAKAAEKTLEDLARDDPRPSIREAAAVALKRVRAAQTP